MIYFGVLFGPNSYSEVFNTWDFLQYGIFNTWFSCSVSRSPWNYFSIKSDQDLAKSKLNLIKIWSNQLNFWPKSGQIWPKIRAHRPCFKNHTVWSPNCLSMWALSVHLPTAEWTITPQRQASTFIDTVTVKVWCHLAPWYDIRCFVCSWSFYSKLKISRALSLSDYWLNMWG